MKLSPAKIRAKRGDRTRREVLAPINNVITQQELMSYEKGYYKPSDMKLPYLLKALNCSYEEIAEPVDLSIAA